MKTFDTLEEMLTDQERCPVCQKKMSWAFAQGKYDEITMIGHKDKIIPHRFAKVKATGERVLHLDRRMVLEDKVIACNFRIKLKDEFFKAKFIPGINKIIKTFPIIDAWLEMDYSKYIYAQEKNMINIWRVVNKMRDDIFAIQTCPKHYKRVSAFEVDRDEDKFKNFLYFDEFYYAPTNRVEGEFYALHVHQGMYRPKGSNTFRVSDLIHHVHKITDGDLDNLDPKRGHAILRAKEDYDLMNYDLTNQATLSRRLHSIHALKG